MNQPLSIHQQALMAIRALRAENEALRRAAHEPIAIVAASCRFPGGVHDLDSYWSVLEQGRDALGPLPFERWPGQDFQSDDPSLPGRIYARRGGFLDGFADFDPSLFGMSDAEAAALDPQQRLLIELAWDALERANMAPDPNATPEGAQVGVFVGLASSGFARFSMLSGDPTRIDNLSVPGFTPSFASGRLAYLFGFQGPVMTFDTACSSSLVALHNACVSLRAGECAAALVAGVNVLVAPEEYVFFCNAAALSPSSQSRPFHAEADGYVRSEGGAVVVLRRLSDAQRDGDRVLGLIAGSAVNHDGRSNGLTAPNGLAQQALLQQACHAAGRSPADVHYVEAHGTGTLLGDPIEVSALGEVQRGAGRQTADPLLIGSVKSNLGHLEAAAGLAGLLKVMLAINKGVVPPSLHSDRLNPHIDWDDLPVKVVRGLTEWPGPAEARCGGVSGFGFSGTNAHVVLAAPPTISSASEPEQVQPGQGVPLVISAMSRAALAAMLDSYAALVEGRDRAGIASIACTLANGRAQMPVGVVVDADKTGDLVAGLRALAAGIRLEKAVLATPQAMAEARSRAAALDLPRVPLVPYPFQRRRFWPEMTVASTSPVHADADAAPLSGQDMPEGDPLTRLWTCVAGAAGLQTAQVSEAAGIVALNLDSITLVRLRFALQNTLGLDVPLAELVACDDWATLLERPGVPDIHDPARESPEPVGTLEGPLALLPLQEAYWVGRRSKEAGGPCGSYFYVEFNAGQVSTDRLARAWNHLVRRHPMLRAEMRDHALFVMPEVPAYTIDHVAQASADDLHAMRGRCSHQRFAEGRWPLFRIETAETEVGLRVAFGIDELIADGASISILLREWQALAQTERDLRDLKYDFGRYAEFLRARWQPCPADLAYWETKGARLMPGPALPMRDQPGGASRRRLKAVLGPDVVTRLESQAAQANVSLTAFVLTVFGRILAKAIGQDEFTLVTTYFNRLPVHPDVDKLVGPLAATKLFAFAAGDAPDVVQAQLMQDAEHDSIDGVSLLRHLRRRGIVRGALPLPVVFTSMIENFDAAGTSVGPAWYRDWGYAVSQTPQVLLDHQIGRRGDSLVLSWDIADEILDVPGIHAMFDAYGRALTDANLQLSGDLRPLVMPMPAPFSATAVQRSYAFGFSETGRNCQVYQELRLPRAEAGRVEAVWRQIIARHDALRVVLSDDGRFVPAGSLDWSLPPELHFSGEADADLEAFRTEMATSRRDPSSWPAFDIRLSQLAGDGAIVHMAIDMLVADWPALQCLLSEMAILLAGQSLPSPTPMSVDRPRSRGNAAYWREKLPTLPAAGLVLRDHAAAGKPERLVHRLPEWPAIAAQARAVGLDPQDALAALTAQALAPLTGSGQVPLVQVSFPRDGEAVQVGDFTRLSWAALSPREQNLNEMAQTLHRERLADTAADPETGLTLMARFGPHRRDPNGLALPFVFSRLLNAPPTLLPAGYARGTGVSSTPGVAVDDVSVCEDGILTVNWDVDFGLLERARVADCFDCHVNRLRRAAQDLDVWSTL